MRAALTVAFAVLATAGLRVVDALPAAGIPPPSVTRGSLRAEGRLVPYKTIAEETAVKGVIEGSQVALFSVSYLEDSGGSQRPIVFVFDGGPGSSSAALLSAYGPRRLPPVETKSADAGGATLTGNPNTVLPSADLVFVDPPGTGFSRFLSGPSGQDSAGKAFWGVAEDGHVAADFIASWLHKHKRLGSPLYIAGRSYGGFRAVVTSDYLSANGRDAGQLAGLILISPLTYNMRSAPTIDRIVAGLPTLAAVAAFHGAGAHTGQPPQNVTSAAWSFADGEYRAALTAEATLDPRTADYIADRLSSFTGLPKSLLISKRLQVDADDLISHLLAEQGERLGKLDGREKEPVTDPGNPANRGPLSASRLRTLAAMSATYARYIRGDLNYPAAGDYVWLSLPTNSGWSWQMPPGYEAGSIAPLRALMARRPALRVLVLGGYYDLDIPYTIPAQMLEHGGLPKSRWEVMEYPSGHFIESDPGAALQESRAIKAFLQPVSGSK